MPSYFRNVYFFMTRQWANAGQYVLLDMEMIDLQDYHQTALYILMWNLNLLVNWILLYCKHAISKQFW